MDDFNIKYKELSLTGNIPVHPHFLYEFFAPADVGKIGGIIPFTEDGNTNYITYTNNAGDKVIATNTVPCVLMYKPKEDVLKCQGQ